MGKAARNSETGQERNAQGCIERRLTAGPASPVFLNLGLFRTYFSMTAARRSSGAPPRTYQVRSADPEEFIANVSPCGIP
jgi:hypothetical protein